MSGQKGFRAAKAQTKQQLIDGQGSQIGQLAGQLKNVTQMVIQTSRHLQQVQQEVALLATLIRYSSESSAPSKNNDFVVIDCVGQVKNADGSIGDSFEGGTLFTHAVELEEGGGKYVPGFVDGLRGKSAGSRFDLTVTFPSDYNLEEVAGKEVVFDTTVLKVLTPSALNNVIMEKNLALKAAAAPVKSEDNN